MNTTRDTAARVADELLDMLVSEASAYMLVSEASASTVRSSLHTAVRLHDITIDRDGWGEVVRVALENAQEHVSTVDELDALPMGAVIVDPAGGVWTVAWRTNGRNTWGTPILTSQELVDYLLYESVDVDFHVVWRPAEPKKRSGSWD